MKIRGAPIATALAALLVGAPVAAAHVTLNPPEWEAGGFAKFDMRVPNENEAGDTTRVVMKFPEEVISASFQPVEGWQRTVKMAQLDEPIDDEGEQITERIDTVTWTGGRIRPGEFQEFGVSFQVPEDAEPGTALAFPAVQTYSNPDRSPALDRSGGCRLAGTDGHGARGAARGGGGGGGDTRTRAGPDERRWRAGRRERHPLHHRARRWDRGTRRRTRGPVPGQKASEGRRPVNAAPAGCRSRSAG